MCTKQKKFVKDKKIVNKHMPRKEQFNRRINLKKKLYELFIFRATIKLQNVDHSIYLFARLFMHGLDLMKYCVSCLHESASDHLSFLLLYGYAFCRADFFTPAEKIKWISIWKSGRAINRSAPTNPPIKKKFIQKLVHMFRKVSRKPNVLT